MRHQNTEVCYYNIIIGGQGMPKTVDPQGAKKFMIAGTVEMLSLILDQSSEFQVTKLLSNLLYF